VAVPAALAEQGDWLLKGGATMVSPKSGNLRLGDLGEVPDVGVVTDASLEVDDGTSFGFTVTYMLTDNWGVELLAAVPFKHDIKLSAVIDGVKDSGKIAETKHLPPTLSLQYHFLPDQMFSPYLGAGINMTLFSGEKIASVLADGLSLDTSTGFAAQVGADVNFSDAWFVNLDIRYIDISTKAKIKVEGEWLPLGNVSIDPIVYSLMLGYRF
jgi:outer membrane protein